MNLSLSSSLSEVLIRDIRAANPWWQGEALENVPSFRRWPFNRLIHSLEHGLAQITVLRGPRQVGKSTLLKQIILKLLASGVEPQRILRIQFDELKMTKKLSEPILEISLWFAESVLGESYNKAAGLNRPAYLLFDEVQLIPDWAPQLKHLVDLHPVRVFITGSSALKIELGRDSLAGRMSTLEMGPLLLREVAELRDLGTIKPLMPENGLDKLKYKEFWIELNNLDNDQKNIRNLAFAAFSERGGFPIAQARTDRPWAEVADHLVESVINRVLKMDLIASVRGKKRNPQLLEELFRLACRFIGQSPSPAKYLSELNRITSSNTNWQRIHPYLQFLEGSLLLKLINTLEFRLKKKKGWPKICLSDHALRAAWIQECVPLTEPELTQNPYLFDLAGRIVESITGYFLSSLPNADLTYFSERATEPEVDFILTIGAQRIPIEVKYRRRIDYEDSFGLRSFIEKAQNNAPFGVMVTMNDEVKVDDPRIVTVGLKNLLLMR